MAAHANARLAGWQAHTVRPKAQHARSVSARGLLPTQRVLNVIVDATHSRTLLVDVICAVRVWETCNMHASHLHGSRFHTCSLYSFIILLVSFPVFLKKGGARTMLHERSLIGIGIGKLIRLYVTSKILKISVRRVFFQKLGEPKIRVGNWLIGHFRSAL